MTQLLLRVAAVSAAVSAVLLPLLLASRWYRRYAPNTRRAVWLVIAAVLLAAPLLPRSQAPVQITVPVRSQLPAAQGAGVGTEDGESAAVLDAPSFPAISWMEALAAVWLAGTAAILLGQGAAYGIARRKLMRGARPLGGYEQLAEELCPGRQVRFFQAEGLGTPMTMGLLRPVVVLPAEADQPLAVRHELIHIRRRDVAWKGFLLLACAVHWFNPLVWLMSRRADRDMEAGCDELVVAGAGAAERRAYGELLLRAAVGRGVPFTTRFGGGKGLMKARLYDLFHPGKRSRLLVGLVLLFCLLAGSLVACRSTETVTAAEAVQALENSVTYEDSVLSFTIPAQYSSPEDWAIHIAGRAETDGLGGISLHYLEDEKWEAGKTYTLDISQEQWEDITELTMDVALGTESRTIDLLAAAGRDGGEDTSEYQLHQVILPSSELEKTDDNAEIFEVDPFAVNLYLPAGWTVREAAAMEQEGEEPYPAVDGIFSIQCILDETGRPVGSLGYNLAPTYEEAIDDPMALFAGITLAKHSFDCRESFVPVTEGEGLLVGTADVVQEYSANEGRETTRNRGILLREERFGVYVAIELDSGVLTQEQTLDIAARLSLSPVEEAVGVGGVEGPSSVAVDGRMADGTYCCAMSPQFPQVDGEVDFEQLELTLCPYDLESGEQGELLDAVTLPLAEDLTLQGVDDESPSAAGAPGTQERSQRIVSFVYWPSLRSTYPADEFDRLVVQVRDGAVASLRWIRIWGEDGDVRIHPITDEGEAALQ